MLQEVTELSDHWNQAVELWKNVALPEDIPYPRLHGANFKEFNKRVMTTLELVAAIGRVDEGGQLLFLPKATSAIQQLRTAKVSVDNLFSQLKSYPNATFKDVHNNLDSVVVYQAGSQVQSFNFGQHLDQVSSSMAALFDLTSAGLRFGKAKGLSIYHNYGEQLQDLAASIRSIYAELVTLHDNATVAVNEAKESSAQAAEVAESASAANAKTEEKLAASKEALAEVDAKLAAIRETAKAAASMQAQVDAYAASFDAFQKSLDDRVAQHNEFQKNIADALTKNENREGEIDRLIAKADSMIKGATTAGLGDSLENTRKLYEKRMFFAGLCFLGAVIALSASAIPLVAHILPGLFKAWLPSAASAAPASVSTSANGDAIVSLMGKIFLMFPATWLTQFFSKAYTEFFHLEREYAHKAALARSVEGFKKQAPKYEEEITTAVFFEVQSNPSKQKAPDAAEHPILGPLMKKFVDALPLGKSSAGEAKPPSA